MWRKRACSILLSFMLAMTAIPFSALPVYAQEAGTVQEEGTSESVTSEAADAAASGEETGTEETASAQDAEEAAEEEPLQQEEETSQEETLQQEEEAAQEETPQQEEEASQEEAAQGETAQEEVLPDDAADSDADPVSAGGDDVTEETEESQDQAEAGENPAQGTEESAAETGEGDFDGSGEAEAADDANTADSAGREDPALTEDGDQAETASPVSDEAAQDAEAVITAEPDTETVQTEAEAEGENVDYHVIVESVTGKGVVMPGDEIELYAKAWRVEDGTESSDGLKYKWEIVEGNPDGYISFKDNIEGLICDSPYATLQFSGDPNQELCDRDELYFTYSILVRVTVYDGTDRDGNPIERVSRDFDGITLKDEYFEIDPLKIDQISVGESITVPFSIKYFSHYFGGFRYGYDVSWKFLFDENILELTDADGNRLDAAGETAFVPAEGVDEPEITIRRLSGGDTCLRAEAEFSYVDHNGTVHDEESLGRDSYSTQYNFFDVADENRSDSRIWFDCNDNRIFADGTYTFELQTENIQGDYDIRLEVGHCDDQSIVDAYTKGTEYDFDGHTLTLYGDKIREKGYFWFGYDVRAVSKEDGSFLCGEFRIDLESRDTTADYLFEEDVDKLIGWSDTVNHWEHVYVENAEYPLGRDMSYEVTGVAIESQEPAESGKDVLDIHVEYSDGDESSDDYWWHYEGLNHGTALVRVDYIDIDGNAQSYTFEVYVKEDVYGVEVYTEDGSEIACPGGTINLLTKAWRHSEDEEQEGVTDNLVYDWNLKGVDWSPDPDTFASLQTAADKKSATLTFSSSDEFKGVLYGLYVEVLIYTGSISEENKVGYSRLGLTMSDSYTEVWPGRIDPSMDVGQTQSITAEYRLYPGTDGQEYDYVGSGNGQVDYYWYYDQNAVAIYDKDGNKVGNEDESHNYIGSDACTGDTCDFTIYRRRGWDTELYLRACWTNPQGEEQWAERRYRLDNKEYGVRVDIEDDRIFSDSSASFPVIVEGLADGAVYGTDYKIDLKVGPEGEEGISDSFTEGKEYTFDGSTITLDGKKLAASGLEDNQMIGVDLTLILGEEPVWVEYQSLRYRDARIDYDFECDRDMLPGWDGAVNGTYHVFVENSEYPDGQDFDYHVTNVEIVSDDPADGEEGPVIDDFHRDENPDDASDYWWYYHVNSRGTAVLKVTYKDLDGKKQDYTFSLNVTDDVYNVWIESEGDRGNLLAGDSLALQANGSHEYYDEDGRYQEDAEGLSYSWSLEYGSEWATIEPDPADPSKATLVCKEMPADMDCLSENVKVGVRVLDAQGEETNGYNNRDFWVHSEYFEIWPIELNQDLDLGASIENQKFEVRYYSLDQDNYEVIDDKFDVRYEWYYDQNDFSITETKDTGTAEVVPGEAADTNTFTFTRLKTRGTRPEVRAVWSENGEERDCHGNYWFGDKNYEIRFDNDDDTIRNDEKKSFAVNTEGLGGLDCEILFIVNYQSGEDAYTDMTMGQEYTVDASGTSVTVDGALADQLISTSTVNPDEFYIGAGILYQGNLLEDSIRWSRVRMERGDKRAQEISAADLAVIMYDTATASVTGAEGALTFISENTDVVTVNAQTGVLTPVAPGTAMITVDAAETDDYYAASAEFTVTVDKLSLDQTTKQIIVPEEGLVYNGESQQPSEVIIKYKETTLTEGKDYTVTYSDNVDAGTAAMTIEGSGSCTGRITADFEIRPAAIDKAVVSGIKNKTYNGKAQTQAPLVKFGTMTLKKDTDYTLSYENNKNAGTATMTITGKGNFEGTADKKFTIAEAAQNFTVKASASSIFVGNTAKVTASGAKETAKYTFVSSNKAIATVSAAGVVTGRKPGTVTITVRTSATKNYKAGSRAVRITVKIKKPGNCHFVKWNNSKYTGCQIGWNAAPGAEGYQTLLSWTDGSHASSTIVKSNVLYRNCTVHPQHVSQMKVRAFYTEGSVRKYGPWSNVEYITPSPTKLTTKNLSKSSNLQMQINWNIIYGCNGYNVFLTTNPNGTWYWNQSTKVDAKATGTVITKYRGSKLKKNTRYYVRIVTRRMRNGVFCTVPMPSANTNIGSFIIK